MVTGHRPPKIGGYKPCLFHERIKEHMGAELEKLKPSHTITGMAQGIDQFFAQVCYLLKIPFHAYLPCRNQDQLWPDSAKQQYQSLLKKAEHIVNCFERTSPDPINSYISIPRLMQLRNECMVNNSDIVLAYWDGSSGGTANCVGYAKKKGKEVRIFNPKEIV